MTGAPVPLAEATETERFGGKAVQLGGALRAGLRVPEGVAIAVELVERLLGSESDAHAWAVEVLRWSGDAPLAVRSSAVDEDGAVASFAGQHATVLGAFGAAAVASALRTVALSATSPSALEYRRSLGISSAPRIAVVVQRMVDAECAGVMFTRCPVAGAGVRSVEASWGLGEAVVQGMVVPDRFRWRREGREVIERAAGNKDIAIRLAPGGGTQDEAPPPERRRALCLDDARLHALEGIARRCEEAFTGDSDVEFAFTSGDAQPWVLQRRAITR
jgi:pyruvate,water dikinase